MKDIYSPLDIDEEWDNMAPMADAPAMPAMSTEGATAVAVKPAEQSPMEGEMDAMSTLPPADSTHELKDPAESAMDVSTMGAPAAEAPMMPTNNGDEKAAGTLELNDINPSTSMAMPKSKDEMTNNSLGADTEKAAATPIPVIDMNEASAEMNSTGDGAVEVGKSFTPEEKPAEDRFAGMNAEQVEPEKTDTETGTKAEMKDETDTGAETPAAAELPVTPAYDKEKMKFDVAETPMPEVSNARLESLMKEWADMKSRTQDKLNDLRKETDEKISKLEEEIEAKEDAKSKAEAERDDIDAQLNELV